MKTCDLCDLHDAQVRVLELPLQDFGGRIAFNGMVSTVRAYEDNSRVREAVEEAGQGRVLVIDGEGSMRRAMIGDLLAAKAAENGWAGVIVFGAIRDSDAIATIALGVRRWAPARARPTASARASAMSKWNSAASASVPATGCAPTRMAWCSPTTTCVEAR